MQPQKLDHSDFGPFYDADSELLILGDPAVVRSLPYHADADGIFLLPGILSRKKQLLPQVLAITADLSRR